MASPSPYPLLSSSPWRTLILFLVIVVTGDRVIAMGLGALQLESEFRYSRLYQGDEKAKIVAIGNSRGVNSFYSPHLEEMLGVEVLNLSYNDMPCTLAEVLIADYLDNNQPPEVLLVEPTCVFSDLSLLPQLASYYRHSDRLTELASTTNLARDSWFERHSKLRQFNNEIWLRSLFYLGRDDQTWINGHLITDAMLTHVETMDVETELVSVPGNVEALGRIAKLAAERGIALRFIIGPYLPAYRQKLAWWPEFIETIEVAAGDKNLVLDFSLSVSDPSHFGDWLHLNRKGAIHIAEGTIKTAMSELRSAGSEIASATDWSD